MRETWRRWSTWLGWGALALFAVSLGLTAVALANGVHCPDCDQHALGDAAYRYWSRYFLVKAGAYGASAMLGLVALPFARRRWPALLGFLGALFAFTLTPM